MKVVESSPQNARNCTVFLNFLGGTCSQTPLATARSFAARDMHTQNPKNFKLGPPLRNPAYTPGYITYYTKYLIWCYGYNFYRIQ